MGFSLAEAVEAACRRRSAHVILFGTGEQELDFEFVGQRSLWQYRAPLRGAGPMLERRYRETNSRSARAEIERFMSMRPCPDCGGRRLRPEALAVRVGGRNVVEVVGALGRGRARLVPRASRSTEREQHDRRQDPEGDRATASASSPRSASTT